MAGLRFFQFNPTNSTENGLMWMRLRDTCPNLSQWGVEILRPGLEKHTKTIAVEPVYLCKDHRNLFSHFYSKRFHPQSPLSQRFHFFAIKVEDSADLLANLSSYRDSYIGFSIIRPVSQKCIGRTVISPERIGRYTRDGFYCLTTRFRAHVCGADLDAYGYPYVSQDGDATLCAQSALWGVCRYLSERYPVYPELYPYDLIRMTDPKEGRTAPYRGMRYQDYCRVLSAFGCFPTVMRLKESRKDSDIRPAVFEDLYSYVESGFPLLASFSGHVVSLIGHTLDHSRKMKSDADGFVDSSQFLKQFVVVDDNVFPYALLGYEGDPENYGKIFKARFGTEYSISSVFSAVYPLPEKVFLPAERARFWARHLFREYEARVLRRTDKPVIARLFVASSVSFKQRKLQRSYEPGHEDPLSFFVTQIDLPHFVWVMEAASVDEYDKHLCHAEIVLDATAGRYDDRKGLIYLRIGNTIKLQGGRMLSEPNAPSVFKHYTHNLGRLP